MRFNNQHGRNFHSGEMLKALGVVGTKLPLEGMPERLIQGIPVWVAPFAPAYRKSHYTGQMVRAKSSTHRVMCRCPLCGQEMSAGRLHQHKCKVTK